jgi:hypothetical protein
MKGFMKRFILVALLILLIPPRAWAQDTQELVLESEYGSLGIAVPVTWESTVYPPDIGFYAVATSRGTDAPSTDVQIVIRRVDELEVMLDEVIDLAAENPALDYLQKYAAWRVGRDEGVYSEPLNLKAITGSLMLYVEKPDGARFPPETGAVLAVAFAIMLDENRLGILLMDGAYTDADPLVDLWEGLLAGVQVDGESVNLSDQLAELESPQSLIARYENAVGFTPAPNPPPDQTLPPEERREGIRHSNNVLTFPVYDTWAVTPSEDLQGIILVSEDESGLMEIRLDGRSVFGVERGDSEALLEAVVHAQGDYTLSSRIISFSWDRHPAAIATLRRRADPRSEAVLLVMEIENTVMSFRFEYTPDVSAQVSSDWYTTLTRLHLNEKLIPPEHLIIAITDLNEAITEP